MRSIEWWRFQWPWRIPNPVFKVTHFWSRISQKRCVLWKKLLNNTNRKQYAIYRMVPLSMTLSDLWPGFQGYGIFKSNIRKDKVTTAQEETIPNIWNGTVWWPWLTSKRVARVCRHQLSFLFAWRGAVCDWQEFVSFWWWSDSLCVSVRVTAALAVVCSLWGLLFCLTFTF